MSNLALDEERLAAVEAWIAIDDEYGEDLQRLLTEDVGRVAELFGGRIAFGTAGLRAPMGPGPMNMNRVVVRQTTVGLMEWLPDDPMVVVGYDARHRSDRFAAEVVDVVTALGGRVELIDRPAPTPVLARAVLDRGADAGIMITASHNPADDNGYKLYLADGIQLVDPADAEIAAAIVRVAAEGWTPVAEPGTVRDIGSEAIEAHRVAAVGALLTTHRKVGAVYTAMHGVGGRHLMDCFAAAGFPVPVVVSEQFDPDPDFPTAPFPNPEEPGAFDLAMATADRVSSDPTVEIGLILANDPDADRLAVAIPDAVGGWRRLSGDEVGTLLVDHVLRHRVVDPADPTDVGQAVVASSIVSARCIDAIAASVGVDSVRTLTGFKWVARPIVDRPDDRFLFGYEEALGYCIGDGVRDKDGISAALVVAEMAAELSAEGSSLAGRLDELAERHGLHATAQSTIRLDELEAAESAALLSRASTLAPETVGDVAVVERQDLMDGQTLPPTTGVVLGLADGSRVIVRPSGTEPKIKVYLEVVYPPGKPGSAKDARLKAGRRLEVLTTALEAMLMA